jgi:hypothetical protein
MTLQNQIDKSGIFSRYAAVDAPIMVRIVSACFPTVEQGTVRAKLSLQTLCRLERMSV